MPHPIFPEDAHNPEVENQLMAMCAALEDGFFSDFPDTPQGKIDAISLLLAELEPLYNKLEHFLSWQDAVLDKMTQRQRRDSMFNSQRMNLIVQKEDMLDRMKALFSWRESLLQKEEAYDGDYEDNRVSEDDEQVEEENSVEQVKGEGLEENKDDEHAGEYVWHYTTDYR